jgi:hypothetical protein
MTWIKRIEKNKKPGCSGCNQAIISSQKRFGEAHHLNRVIACPCGLGVLYAQHIAHEIHMQSIISAQPIINLPINGRERAFMAMSGDDLANMKFNAPQMKTPPCVGGVLFSKNCDI